MNKIIKRIKKIKTRILMLVVILLVSISFNVYAADKNKSKRPVDRIEVNGEFTYKYCLNECGIYNEHYIYSANVMIYNDCIFDPNCSICLDECAQELMQNNPDLYNNIMNSTIRRDDLFGGR